MANWATPFPNDQFSFFTSTRLMNQSNRQLRMQTVNNGFIEQLFLFDGATFAQRDLNHHQVVGADCLIRTTAPQLSLCFC